MSSSPEQQKQDGSDAHRVQSLSETPCWRKAWPEGAEPEAVQLRPHGEEGVRRAQIGAELGGGAVWTGRRPLWGTGMRVHSPDYTAYSLHLDSKAFLKKQRRWEPPGKKAGGTR